ncbi:hypothetical protein [Corynebacterium renale]|uniref:hypothetical protein n=1 Tax=Corynebacterium renale TaxID=1724 RepID=UPI000BF34700|nr:hypothetical protein [Corynebacterium renale]
MDADASNEAPTKNAPPDFLKSPLVLGDYPDDDYTLDVPVVCDEIPSQFFERVLDSRPLSEPKALEFVKSSVCAFRDKQPDDYFTKYEYYIAADMAYKAGIAKDGEIMYENVSQRFPSMYTHHFPDSVDGCTASIHTTRGALRLSYILGLGVGPKPPRPHEQCPDAVQGLEKILIELGVQ